MSRGFSHPRPRHECRRRPGEWYGARSRQGAPIVLDEVSREGTHECPRRCAASGRRPRAESSRPSLRLQEGEGGSGISRAFPTGTLSVRPPRPPAVRRDRMRDSEEAQLTVLAPLAPSVRQLRLDRGVPLERGAAEALVAEENDHRHHNAAQGRATGALLSSRALECHPRCAVPAWAPAHLGEPVRGPQRAPTRESRQIPPGQKARAGDAHLVVMKAKPL